MILYKLVEVKWQNGLQVLVVKIPGKEGAGGLASDLDKVESVPSVLSFAGQSGPGRLNRGS